MKGAVTATLTSNGNIIPPEYEILSIDTVKTVNKIPFAELTLVEGKTAEQPFSICDSKFFEPGAEVEIKLRYEGEATKELTIFKGLVVKNKIEMNRKGTLLNVVLKGYHFKMTLMRESTISSNKNDKEIIEKIIGKYSDIKTKSVAAINYKHLQMLQYDCTDWDFMLSRAEANGIWLLASDDSLSLEFPSALADKKVAHTFNINNTKEDIQLNELEMEADICSQLTGVKAQTWESDNLKLSAKIQGDNFTFSQDGYTNISKDALLKQDYEIIYPVNLQQDELKNWATAKLQKTRLSLLRGRLQIDGKADIQLGQKIKIVGAAKYFEGETLVTGVRHQVNSSGWQTHVQFGLVCEWFYENNTIMQAPASGLLPAVNGLQLATVIGYEKNDNHKFQVKIELPIFGKAGGIVWAKLASIYASNKKGVVFRPEKGDEVIIGFFNNDPREPVILGSLHNKKNPPPLEMSEENHEKGIVISETLQVLIDAKEKEMGIQVEKNEIVISDKSAISIKDKNDNKLDLTDSGIAVTTNKDLKQKASGKIILEGSAIEHK